MSNETKKYAGLDALQTFLEGCKTLFASITHKHTISDITDYKVDTALSSTSTNPIQNKVINAEFDAISEAMGTLEAAIDDKLDTSMASSTYETKENAQTKYDNAIAHSDANLETAKNYADTVASGKSDINHNHDGRYYTESEIDVKLSNKTSIVVSDTEPTDDTDFWLKKY